MGYVTRISAPCEMRAVPVGALPHMGSAMIEGRVNMGAKIIITFKILLDGHARPDCVPRDDFNNGRTFLAGLRRPNRCQARAVATLARDVFGSFCSLAGARRCSGPEVLRRRHRQGWSTLGSGQSACEPKAWAGIVLERSGPPSRFCRLIYNYHSKPASD